MFKKRFHHFITALLPLTFITLGFSTFSIAENALNKNFDIETQTGSFSSFLFERKSATIFGFCHNGFVKDGKLTETGLITYYLDLDLSKINTEDYVKNNDLVLQAELIETGIANFISNERLVNTRVLFLGKEQLGSNQLSDNTILSSFVLTGVDQQSVISIDLIYEFKLTETDNCLNLYNLMSNYNSPTRFDFGANILKL